MSYKYLSGFLIGTISVFLVKKYIERVEKKIFNLETEIHNLKNEIYGGSDEPSDEVEAEVGNFTPKNEIPPSQTPSSAETSVKAENLPLPPYSRPLQPRPILSSDQREEMIDLINQYKYLEGKKIEDVEKILKEGGYSLNILSIDGTENKKYSIKENIINGTSFISSDGDLVLESFVL